MRERMKKKEKVCEKLFHIYFDCTNHLLWCLVFLGMGNQIKANDEAWGDGSLWFLALNRDIEIKRKIRAVIIIKVIKKACGLVDNCHSMPNTKRESE